MTFYSPGVGSSLLTTPPGALWLAYSPVVPSLLSITSILTGINPNQANVEK
jgi:hypothetical protein